MASADCSSLCRPAIAVRDDVDGYGFVRFAVVGRRNTTSIERRRERVLSVLLGALWDGRRVDIENDLRLVLVELSTCCCSSCCLSSTTGKGDDGVIGRDSKNIELAGEYVDSVSES